MHSFLAVYPFALDFDVLFIRGIKIKQKKKTPESCGPFQKGGSVKTLSMLTLK